MKLIYALFNKIRMQNTAFLFPLLILFLQTSQVTAQASHHNSDEFSRNTLAAYIVVSGLGVGITILFMCYLYIRAQSGCCCIKGKNTSQDLQATNTLNTAQRQIYLGVNPFPSGTNYSNFIGNYLQISIFNYQ